jgi:hypothetical protein
MVKIVMRLSESSILTAPEAFTGVDIASELADPVRWYGKENHILLPLVVPLGVVMEEVMFQAMPQGFLPEHDDFGQYFGVHGSDPSFAMGIEDWAPGRQP